MVIKMLTGQFYVMVWYNCVEWQNICHEQSISSHVSSDKGWFIEKTFYR